MKIKVHATRTSIGPTMYRDLEPIYQQCRQNACTFELLVLTSGNGVTTLPFDITLSSQPHILPFMIYCLCNLHSCRNTTTEYIDATLRDPKCIIEGMKFSFQGIALLFVRRLQK